MGAKRAVPLPVSAPFHCPLMQPAAEAMADALSYVVIRPPAVPLVPTLPPNRPAIPTRSATSWSSRLPAWSAGAKASPTWPTAASRNLSSLAARCSARWSSASSPDAKVTSVVTIEDIEALAKELYVTLNLFQGPFREGTRSGMDLKQFSMTWGTDVDLSGMTALVTGASGGSGARSPRRWRGRARGSRSRAAMSRSSRLSATASAAITSRCRATCPTERRSISSFRKRSRRLAASSTFSSTMPG